MESRKLLDLLKKSKAETVTFETEIEKGQTTDFIRVGLGPVSAKLMGMDPRSFPAMPCVLPQDSAKKIENEKIVGFTISAQNLADMIDHTIFAVSADEARYNLSGVCIDSPAAGVLRFVAQKFGKVTKKHPASTVRSVAGEETVTKAWTEKQSGYIIPRELLAAVRATIGKKPSGNVEVVLAGDPKEKRGAKTIFFRVGAAYFSAWLVEGQFPDYNNVVPKEFARTVTVGVEPLLMTLAAMRPFVNGHYHGAKFEFEGNALTISALSVTLGEAKETLTVEIDGETFEQHCGFNIDYIEQFCKVIGDGKVTLMLPPADTETVMDEDRNPVLDADGQPVTRPCAAITGPMQIIPGASTLSEWGAVKRAPGLTYIVMPMRL